MRDEDRRAVPDRLGEGRGGPISTEEQRGDHHQVVPGQIGVHLDEVNGVATLEQRRMPPGHGLERVPLHRSDRRLERPGVLPVPDDRGARVDLGTTDVTQLRKQPSGPHDVRPHGGLPAGMRNHPGVEHLRPPGGLPPLELADGVRAVSHQIQAPQRELPGALRRVAGPPLHGSGCLLHLDERSTVPQ
ncbi:hypothetical protein SDC9_197355 [bioreactor metagenome]|uniref:Uncharacterized protein n=1 Tax=bioreactor metagenome TaxID=1076179 RepID=A0A645IR20_9ZZZZ